MAVLETIGFWSRGGIIGRGKPLPEGTEGIEGLMICLTQNHLTAKAWWDLRMNSPWGGLSCVDLRIKWPWGPPLYVNLRMKSLWRAPVYVNLC